MLALCARWRNRASPLACVCMPPHSSQLPKMAIQTTHTNTSAHQGQQNIQPALCVNKSVHTHLDYTPLITFVSARSHDMPAPSMVEACLLVLLLSSYYTSKADRKTCSRPHCAGPWQRPVVTPAAGAVRAVRPCCAVRVAPQVTKCACLHACYYT
jgi:hypothetical protein